VTHDIALIHFVVEAIEEKLGRKTRPKKGRRKRSLAAHPAAAYPNTAFNSRNFASPAWASHAAVSSSATPRSLASRWIAFQASLLGRTWPFSHRLTVEQVVPAESASRRAFSGTDIAPLGPLRVIVASLPCDREEFAREAMACCDVTPSALAERRIVPEPPSGSRWRGEKGGIP